jgi:LacI family transcriptional regulator
MERGSPMTVPSVRDVATHAGVSVGTVSNVLNHPEKVLPRTVERVNASICALGFIRNDAARQLRAGRSRTLGLVVLDVRNPFFTDLARGAEDAAARAGLSLTLGNSAEDPEREAAYLDLFEQQRVHGVLISPYGDIAGRLGRLRKHGIPAVLVDRPAGDESLSSVSVDDVAGGRMAVEHLLEQGRRRIAFVGGPLRIRQVTDRLHGATLALDGRDATLEVLETEALTVAAGRAVGAALGDRSPGRRPDAVFAANDLLAMGLLQAFTMRHEIDVPRDVALIGYDDIAMASAAVVPLSSIRQPSELLGSTAVDILLAEAADADREPSRVIFQPELVVRSSTGPGQGAAGWARADPFPVSRYASGRSE